MLTGSDVCPFLTVKLVGFAPRLKSQPVPVNATVCGLLGSLSVMVSVPVRGFDVDVGVNVTLIMQLEFPVRLPLHPLVSPKSPDAAIELIVRVLELLLVSITGCAVLVVVTNCPGNVSVVGETVMEEFVPVPESCTVWVAGIP